MDSLGLLYRQEFHQENVLRSELKMCAYQGVGHDTQKQQHREHSVRGWQLVHEGRQLLEGSGYAGR